VRALLTYVCFVCAVAPKPTDRIKLNIAGTVGRQVQRSVLTAVAGSRLSWLFSGRWDATLPRDSRDQVFLNYDPVLVNAILDMLQRRLRDDSRPVSLDTIPAELRDEFEDLAETFGVLKFLKGVSSISQYAQNVEREREAHIAELAAAAIIANPHSVPAVDFPFSDEHEPLVLLQRAINSLRAEWTALLTEETRIKHQQNILTEEETYLEIHVEEHMHEATDFIELDVRGVTLVPLRSWIEFAKESLLATHVETELAANGPDSPVYIDEDAPVFSRVLEGLRRAEMLGGDAWPPVVSSLRDLYADAVRSLGLEGVLSLERPSAGATRRPVLAARPFNVDSSALIRRDHYSTLCSWFGNGTELRLLYRGSRDGFTAERFHALCDSMGPTLVVIRSKTTEAVFGGYAAQSWQSPPSAVYTKSKECFLFSLDAPVNVPRRDPVRLGIKPDQDQFAMICYQQYGPTFGRGHDLHVSNDCSQVAASSYCHVNYSYEAPPQGESAASFCAGQRNFIVEEMEVFAVVQPDDGARV
jgi:hypothetical protein